MFRGIASKGSGIGGTEGKVNEDEPDEFCCSSCFVFGRLLLSRATIAKNMQNSNNNNKTLKNKQQKEICTYVQLR